MKWRSNTILPERIYNNTKVKPWRKGRTHYPHRIETVRTEYGPYGKIITKETAAFKVEEVQKPDRENGAWEEHWKYGRFKNRRSKTSGRYYLFYNDEFLEELSQLEQIELATRILKANQGLAVEVNGSHKGKTYYKYFLVSKSAWKRTHEAW